LRLDVPVQAFVPRRPHLAPSHCLAPCAEPRDRVGC